MVCGGVFLQVLRGEEKRLKKRKKNGERRAAKFDLEASFARLG